MATLIQIRRDSSANWAGSNPVLAQGEMGFALDANNLKVGDGVTPWNSLPSVSTTPEDMLDSEWVISQIPTTVDIKADSEWIINYVSNNAGGSGGTPFTATHTMTANQTAEEFTLFTYPFDGNYFGATFKFTIVDALTTVPNEHYYTINNYEGASSCFPAMPSSWQVDRARARRTWVSGDIGEDSSYTTYVDARLINGGTTVEVYARTGSNMNYSGMEFYVHGTYELIPSFSL